jgi:4'-phosphopantetheinyl transferase
MKGMLKSKLSISFINSDDQKSSASKELFLNLDDVIIYKLYLPAYTSITKDLIRHLNSDEVNRANRYYKEKDRSRFIISRAILKFVLAAYTKSDIKKISLDYDFNKKPFLGSYPWLHFNVSHSDDFALIAISRSKVGIDVEFKAKEFDFSPLVPDIFTENEISFVQNAEDKEDAFYSLWTRKEAYVKAVGKGIDDDFKKVPSLIGQHSFDSSVLKTEANWQIFSFNVAEGYLGAVAFESATEISKTITISTLPKTIEDLLDLTQIKD